MQTNYVWGIQTTFKSKNYLTFNHKNGKALYFSTDKKPFVPVIFQTKQEAVKAIRLNNRTKEKMPKNLFTNVLEGASAGKPVKVKMQILN